jgi:phosphoribosylformylglycinamidine synthase I
MTAPLALVLRAPGTNCDQETVHAFAQAGCRTRLVHINQLRETPSLADDAQILCIPGGFSYGDDIGAGRILAGQIRHHLADMLAGFVSADKLVLGICNGFQVLIQTGCLIAGDHKAATLSNNDSGKFEDRWTQLRVTTDRSVFLRGMESAYLPIAHAEGKFVVRDEEMLTWLADRGQLALRYTSSSDQHNGERLPYPDNPNGSVANVAGMCDESGRVLGLMPHPERFIGRTQHPRWTRAPLPDAGDGLRIFENAARYFD